MPRVVILEPQTPGYGGEDFCREIRRPSPSMPILTQRHQSRGRQSYVAEVGADDYVTKPFSPRELLARVRAAVRRFKQDASNNGDNHSFGNVQVNFSSMEVLRGGVAVQLTPQEFKMLRFFLDNAGRVISNHELLQQAWDNRAHPGSRTIATHVLRLRQKLEENPAKPVYICTVHGSGYKFRSSDQWKAPRVESDA